MGVRRLGDRLRRARGTRTQRAAADHFKVPYSTLCAIEQGKVRNYQPHTLAQFDAMIGGDAWDVYANQPDEPVDVAAAADVDDLARRLETLEEAVRALAAGPADALAAVAGELTPVERDEVVAFAHWVLARRRGTA
jgi:hypothetical protein